MTRRMLRIIMRMICTRRNSTRRRKTMRDTSRKRARRFDMPPYEEINPMIHHATPVYDDEGPVTLKDPRNREGLAMNAVV